MSSAPPSFGVRDDPPADPAAPGRRATTGQKVAVILAGTAIGCFAMVLPVLWGFVPYPARDHRVAAAVAVGAVTYGLIRWRAASPSAAGARRLLARIDRAADRALPGGLGLAAGIAAGVLLAGWVPHYICWPWFRDFDTFTVIAQQWDDGILPYRDIRTFNFPGHTYIFWLLGKLFGWGHTAPFYALDAMLVVGLGLALAGWSRRQFGTSLPGLVAYLAWLASYLHHDYIQVAQRDWHATLGVVLAILAVESWPGRRGLAVAAVLIALASTIRPHVVLFGPALISAIGERGGITRRGWAATVVLWGLAVAGLATLAFLPLLTQGLMDDLIWSVRIASYGGPFARFTPVEALGRFGEQFLSPWVLGALAANLGLVIAGPRSLRGKARTWGLAMVGALAYRPLHPVPHDYLVHPLSLVGSVAGAPGLAWLIALPVPAVLRALAVALIAWESFPRWPVQVRHEYAGSVVWDVLRGRMPRGPFPGASNYFPLEGRRRGEYEWDDYLAVMDHIRRTTGPDTIVANVLRRMPYPSINGPTGRPSPFRVESGVCWMVVVDEDYDARYAEQLEAAGDDAVVVWSPEERPNRDDLELPRLTALIRREFRPAAKFGEFEVWRRAGAAGSPDLGSAGLGR